MKITMTRNALVAGFSYAEGDVVDASDRDAKFLIGIEKAVLFEDKSGKAEKAAAAEAEKVAADEAKAQADAEAAAALEAEKAAAADPTIATAVPGGKRKGRK